MRTLLGTVLLMVLACKARQDYSFHRIGEVIIKTDFICNHRFIGICSDGVHNDALFYLGDPVTKKKIGFYKMNGDKVFSVSLKRAVEDVGEIVHFQVISPDTIVVFGKSNNKMAVLNRGGVVWKVVDMSSFVEPYGGNKLLYTNTYSGDCIAGDRMYLHVEYIAKDVFHETPDAVNYFREALDVPYFLIVDSVFGNSPSYKYELTGFYRRLMNDTMAMSELPRYCPMNDGVCILSVYSDSVYLYGSEMEEVGSFRVTSDKTDIGVRPVALSTTDAYAKYLYSVVRYSGYISRLMYDKLTNVYLVVVACDNSNTKDKPRRYTCCFYSESGMKLGEYYFPGDDFDPGLIYQHGGQIFISEVDPLGDDYHNGIYKFGVYEICN